MRNFIIEPLRESEEQHRDDCADADGVDRETLCVLLSVPFAVTLREYLNLGESLYSSLAAVMPTAWGQELLTWTTAIENQEIARLIAWTLAQTLSFLILPILVIKIFLRRPLTEYGVKLRGATKGWWIYAVMFLVMVGPILFLSSESSFQQTYPFYRLRSSEPLWPRFLVWELLYAVQFVSIEFFFRGYVLHGTRRRFGPYSILVMTIPYCMIHFGKPLPETIGSIGAGLILGLMSLKTRSIWLGALLHIAVAWTMDGAAIGGRSDK
ncbi:MAG: type II CAAX endopeptidase family protein [Pirellulaceae bacterium]|nr:type II CAAX endopeptidase family protein [Pirellulaceae bacterium]